MEEDVKDEIGRAMGRIASGLFIVTSSFEDHREGMLGSWLTQAAFDPPAITFAIKKNRGLRLLVESSGSCVVNVIGQDDGGLMGPFFKAPEPGQDAFAGLNVESSELAGGSPILKDSLAWMACSVQDCMDAGDHVVYLAEVVGGALLKKGDPKTHVRETGFKY